MASDAKTPKKQPAIVYDEKLKEYMEKKGLHCIALGELTSVGDEAGIPEVTTKFVKDENIEAEKAKSGLVFEGELGPVLVQSPAIQFSDTLELGLRNFLGAKDITVKGATLFSLG